jgi:hypothetical protein
MADQTGDAASLGQQEKVTCYLLRWLLFLWIGGKPACGRSDFGDITASIPAVVDLC